MAKRVRRQRPLHAKRLRWIADGLAAGMTRVEATAHAEKLLGEIDVTHILDDGTRIVDDDGEALVLPE